MLYFVGLGLYDEKDISIKGLERIRDSDEIFLESYTSRLTGTNIQKMELLYGKKLTILGRHDVENEPEKILEAAKKGDAVFLTGGDPMVSTTHSDLRIRAMREGIETAIIHASSIQSAVCGLSGLQNYRFGKSCSVPYPEKGWFPTTPLNTILKNLDDNLHTIVFLDIKPDRFMTVNEGIEIIEQMAGMENKTPPKLYIGIARAGSDAPAVIAGDAEKLKSADFGDPLHILIVPGELHMMEQEYLETFAGL